MKRFIDNFPEAVIRLCLIIAGCAFIALGGVYIKQAIDLLNAGELESYRSVPHGSMALFLLAIGLFIFFKWRSRSRAN